MPAIPFSRYFSANAELQKIRLGNNQQSDSYLTAILSLKSQMYPAVERLVNGHQGQGDGIESLEIAGIAVDMLADRICAGRCYKITSAFLNFVISDARRTHGRRHIPHFPDDYDPEDNQDPGAGENAAHFDEPHPELRHQLENLIFELVRLGRCSWIYYCLAFCRTSVYGWKGQLAEVYLGDRTRQATITRIQTELEAVARATNQALTDWSNRTIRDEPSLCRFFEALSQIAARTLAATDPVEIEQFAASLVTDGLQLLQEIRPATGFASVNYQDLADALEQSFQSLADGNIEHAGAAAATLKAAGRTRQPVDYTPLIPWLQSLPQAHRWECEVADVLQGISKLPVNMADHGQAEEETATDEQKRNDAHEQRHLDLVNKVTTAIQQQACQEPEWTQFVSLWQCDSRADLLEELSRLTNAMEPWSERPELQQEMLKILAAWQQQPANQLRPVEQIFPHVLPAETTLQECQQLLPDLADNGWDHVNAEQRGPILAALSVGVFSRLQEYFKPEVIHG